MPMLVELWSFFRSAVFAMLSRVTFTVLQFRCAPGE
jgi:hypothetical protein